MRNCARERGAWLGCERPTDSALWAAVEVGFEGRLVLPTVPDPDTTAVLGVVARLHPHQLLRVDASLWLAVTSEKFYKEHLATVADTN